MNIQFYPITFEGHTQWYMHCPFYTKDRNLLKVSDELAELIQFLAPTEEDMLIRFEEEPFNDDDIMLTRKKQRKSNLFAFQYDGKLSECALPQCMDHLGISYWSNIYLSFNDFSEQIEELEPIYFKAMEHFGYSEKIAKHEWVTLISTGKWIWWNILALWSDYATANDLKWCLGDSRSMTAACLRTFSQGVDSTWPEPMIELFWNNRLAETEGLNLVVFSEEDLNTAQEWCDVVCKGFIPFFRWKLISEIEPVVPQSLHLFREDVFIWMKKNVGLRFEQTGVWADYLIRGEREIVREKMNDFGVLDTIPYELYEEVIPDLACKSEIVWNNYIEYYKNK